MVRSKAVVSRRKGTVGITLRPARELLLFFEREATRLNGELVSAGRSAHWTAQQVMLHRLESFQDVREFVDSVKCG